MQGVTGEPPEVKVSWINFTKHKIMMTDNRRKKQAEERDAPPILSW